MAEVGPELVLELWLWKAMSLEPVALLRHTPTPGAHCLKDLPALLSCA